MITSTIVATALLFALGPQQQPQALDARPSHTVVGQDDAEPDGRRGRWASVEYELPVRAGKYIMFGVIGATTAACCAGGGPACGGCLAGAPVVIGITDDLFEGYCD
jgi:hypothetical protein